ncbi:MAG: hypothetical protein U0Q22_15540 [Acidimicrobiales bacterium]
MGTVTWSPDERRPAVDVARIVALAVVVLGHLTLAVIDVGPQGSLRGANLLSLRPGWAWIAVCSPMPLFFAAAGWANATTDLRSSAPRLRTLVGLGAAVVCAWVALLAVTSIVTGSGGVVSLGARIATQPLWFLAAYFPLAAVGPLMTIAGRHPVVSVGACLGLLAALDAARFVWQAPDWIGWPGFAAAWAIPWILGVWWRRRCEAGGFAELPVGVALAAVGAVACVVLVRAGGYSPALIDAVSGARSNTTPPTLYTGFAGVTQVGLLLTVAPVLDAVGRRGARWLGRAGEAAVGIYVLHLSALALCAGVVGLGVPVPTRLTGWWWASRPLWFAAVMLITAALVRLASGMRRRSRAGGAPGETNPAPSTGVLWAGVALVTVGAAVVGLKGPRTVLTAAICAVTFVLGWWCLRGTLRPPRRDGEPAPS